MFYMDSPVQASPYLSHLRMMPGDEKHVGVSCCMCQLCL